MWSLLTFSTSLGVQKISMLSLLRVVIPSSGNGYVNDCNCDMRTSRSQHWPRCMRIYLVNSLPRAHQEKTLLCIPMFFLVAFVRSV
jgi:hypothetical protein